MYFATQDEERRRLKWIHFPRFQGRKIHRQKDRKKHRQKVRKTEKNKDKKTERQKTRKMDSFIKSERRKRR